MEQSKKEIFQWHPAFYAGLQVELKEDAQNLIFENEHQLGTRPKETVEKLLEAYEEHMNEGLYRSVMDMIVRANKKKFKEAEEMCEALEELLYERFKEKHKDEAEAEKEAAIEAAVEATRMESHRVGLQEGEELFARLSCMLLKSGRQEEILKAAQDREYRQKLFEELGIKTES